MWLRIKKLINILFYKSNSQIHFGEGDNVAGNKIVNLNVESPKVDDFIRYHLEYINSERNLNKELLSISFENNASYPKLNFSITNRSNYPIQITAINCIKAASIKNKEKGEIDYLTGPRLKIKVNVEKINSGYRRRIFGDEMISNLNAYESEAFQLDFETKNTSNLLELEVEYTSPIRDENQIHVSQDLIFVGTPFEDDKYFNKKVGVIPRNEAVLSIIDGKNPDTLSVIPNTLLLRGTAYVFRLERVNKVLDLFNLYEDSFDLGSILASYSEYIINNKVDERIIKYLYDWIWDPSRITKTIGTDIESYPITIFKNLTSGYSKQKKLIFTIKSLDSLIEISNKIDDTPDSGDLFDRPGMIDLFKQMSLVHLRKQILKSINVDDNKKIYPIIISLLNINDSPSMINDFMEEFTGQESDLGLGRDEDVLEFWNDWYLSKKGISLDYLKLSSRFSLIHSIIFLKLSKTELLELSNNEDIVIRFALSRKRDLPLDVLNNLATDSNDTIRYELTRKKNTPLKILGILSKDKNSIIRRWVAAHKNIDQEIFEKLSIDQRIEVRRFLIGNSKISIDTLKKMRDKEVDSKLKEEISEKINSAQNKG